MSSKERASLSTQRINKIRIGFHQEKTKTALSGACLKIALTELLYQELLVGG